MSHNLSPLAICDANILIDYAEVDEDIIRETVKYWKRLIVPDCVLDEVYNLTKARAVELGVEIIDMPPDLASQPGLSYQDVTCLHFSIELKAVCMTNDVKLKRVCESEGLTVVRGLKMLLLLYEANQITYGRAEDIAKRISQFNPEIKPSLISTFQKELKKMQKK